MLHRWGEDFSADIDVNYGFIAARWPRLAERIADAAASGGLSSSRICTFNNDVKLGNLIDDVRDICAYAASEGSASHLVFGTKLLEGYDG